MNERFRELAKQQAGAILMDLVMPDSGMPERVKWNIGITTEHLEKFAELIVRECAEIGDNYQEILGNEPECYNCRKVAYGIVDKIKKHFGVEEK
jgi:hypothetical protein